MTKARNYKIDYAYHITIRGNNKEDIFFKGQDYSYYITLISRYFAINDVPLIAYCLMPNHVHILVEYNEYSKISKAMHMINLAYTSHINKIYKRCGRLFQNTYYSKMIKDLEYLEVAIKYIKTNPVKASLVKEEHEYQWSYIDQKSLIEIFRKYTKRSTHK